MEFDRLKRLGVKVVEVQGLDVGVAYVPKHRVFLLCAGIPQEGRAKAEDWIIAETARRLVLEIDPRAGAATESHPRATSNLPPTS